MFTKSKYIIIGRDEMPIVFPEVLKHSDVARMMGGEQNVTGAGFCHIIDDKYVCYGESTSLNVKSRGQQDSRILNFLLGAAE